MHVTKRWYTHTEAFVGWLGRRVVVVDIRYNHISAQAKRHAHIAQ